VHAEAKLHVFMQTDCPVLHAPAAPPAAAPPVTVPKTRPDEP